jgi:membrane protein DedA with SNARE-associated domain/membrane-associated phospholipid phosphatase
MGIVAGLSEWLLSLPTWLVLGLVFLLPALEASAFIGFIFPGEVAVLIGGVVAYQGRVPLWGVIAAAVAGAVIGDSVGYLVGKRWGDRLLRGSLGRLPFIRRHVDEHLESARAYVRRRKASAVFFGRFVAALRVLVPGLAGMSNVHYPTFLAFNVAGGALWGAGFAVLGYVAGASYRHVEKVAGRIGLLLLALIVLGLLTSRLLKRRDVHLKRLETLGDRLAALPPSRWMRRRYARQLAWLRARMNPEDPRGFRLTFTVAVGALAIWAFGGLTQDVVGRDEVARIDPNVLRWVLAHRSSGVTTLMKVATWFGSTVVLIPVLLFVATVLMVRHHDWRSSALLALALAGAIGLYDIVKAAVARSRPPASAWIGRYTGGAFPSGHATQSIAFYGMLAIVLWPGRSGRTRALLIGGAVIAVVVVGASRIYLGAHWMSDVLGGWSLGVAWLTVLLAIDLLTRARGRGDRTERAEGRHTAGSGPPERRAA